MILGALFGVPSFTFPVWMEVHVSTCRRHMYMQGQRRVLCPLVQDQWGLYLMGWNEFSRKSTPA